MHGNVMIIVKPTVGQVILKGLAGIKCGAKSFIVLVLFRYDLYLMVIVKTGRAAMLRKI